MKTATNDTDPAFRRHMDERFERIKVAAKAKKRKRQGSGQYTNENPQIAFLRRRISRLNYGVKIEGIGVRPELNSERLIDRYNRPVFGHGHCGAALRNDQFTNHFNGMTTYYFWADPSTAAPEILAMIDIDVHNGVGTPEGARRFAEVIKDKLFPGMYYEPSTNGNGVHGYIVVEKAGVGVKKVRTALKNLDVYLKELAKSVNADISCAEVKGQPPVIRYDKYGNIEDLAFGQFGKLPRGIGVMDTRTVKYADLVNLDVADIVPASIAGITAASSTEKAEMTAATKKMRLGSLDTRIVTQEILDQLPALERYAAKLLVQWNGSPSFKADRWSVTAADLAQFFAVMLAMKPDLADSLPVRRIGRLWEAVFEAGDFSRPWNHHRFKAIRDLISSHGHIDWTDFRYQNAPDGRGRACRWRLGCMLEGQLLSFVEGGTTSVDTDESLMDGQYEYHTPKWFNFALERERQRREQAERRLNALFAA